MSNTNPRDLIRRLTEKLDHLHCYYNVPDQSALIAEARDYLDQSVPAEPTDEEIEQFADDAGFVKGHAYDECGFRIHDEVGFARAILARWGK